VPLDGNRARLGNVELRTVNRAAKTSLAEFRLVLRATVTLDSLSPSDGAPIAGQARARHMRYSVEREIPSN